MRLFAQVHLEVDPLQYESDNATYASLKQSNTARLEIMRDLLGSQLGLDCATAPKEEHPTTAYFLGRHEVRDEGSQVAFAFCLILFTSLVLVHFFLLFCLGAYLFTMQIFFIFF